jgi:hypothetical protein
LVGPAIWGKYVEKIAMGLLIIGSIRLYGSIFYMVFVQTQALAAWERFRQYDPKTAAMEEVAWPENAGGISTMGWKRSIINRYQISTVLF